MGRLHKVPERVRIDFCIRLPKPDRMKLYGHWNVEVYVLYGEPGLGKSLAPRQMYPDLYVVPIQRKGNFFLEPEGHLAEVVLIEDFDGNMPLKDFNQRLDPYPIRAESKGGYIDWCPRIIFLTTNTLPGKWYNYSTRQNVQKQVYRRITYCFDFNTPEGARMEKGMSCDQLEQVYADRMQVERPPVHHYSYYPPASIPNAYQAMVNGRPVPSALRPLTPAERIDNLFVGKGKDEMSIDLDDIE